MSGKNSDSGGHWFLVLIIVVVLVIILGKLYLLPALESAADKAWNTFLLFLHSLAFLGLIVLFVVIIIIAVVLLARKAFEN